MSVQAQVQCIQGTGADRISKDTISQIEAEYIALEKFEETISWSNRLLQFVEDEEAMDVVRNKVFITKEDKAVFEKSREHFIQVLKARDTDPKAYAEFEMFDKASMEMDTRLAPLRDAITNHLNLY